MIWEKILSQNQEQSMLFHSLVRGILDEVACGDTGTLQMEGEN